MHAETKGTLDFEVVIVGGRPAGASLAARLGARGVRVLVIDRAELRSQPAVPSCPLIYPAAIRLLHEIGLDEAAYVDESARCRLLVVQVHTHFQARMPVPGDARIYGLDRGRFDHALWVHLTKYPSVTTRRGFAFLDLVRDDAGQVIGIEGQQSDGPRETIRARCVVGADGRYSLVARRAGAGVIEDFPDHTSAVYFAEWEGIDFVDPRDRPAQIYATARGTNVMFFPMPNGRVSVATHMRSDRVDIDGDADRFYQGVLQRYGWVQRRLTGARRVGPLAGIKRIANRYVEAGGPGWVLVGDALHHKDPVDGQGIYDALVEAKILDEELAPFLAGERPFAVVVEAYRRRVHAETHPMFLATMDRLERELYEEPPTMVIRTLMRWTLTDPEYQERFLRFLCRDIPPETWMTPAVMRGCVARGVLRDLRQAWSCRRAPADLRGRWPRRPCAWRGEPRRRPAGRRRTPRLGHPARR
jgi:2-polyprenyl-6-methoxyphenol hydroxylase-like FAD-dependent oxidoreductase